jgi:hypothetical protein
MIKIMDCRGFPHELGIHADTEVFPLLFTRFLFQEWAHQVIHCSGQNGTPDDYDMKAVSRS